MAEPRVTLTYFDIAASRGEDCRLALLVAGVPFEDVRVASADWPRLRPTTPFGALPVLTIEGHPPLAQTNAILRLVGRRHGLHPLDDWEAARHDALLEAVEDFRHEFTPSMDIEDPDEKRRVRQALAQGYLQEWGGFVERQLAAGPGPFVAGPALHVVDLKLYVMMSPFRRGTMDHVPATVFAAFPRLCALYDAVARHPRVAAWSAR